MTGQTTTRIPAGTSGPDASLLSTTQTPQQSESPGCKTDSNWNSEAPTSRLEETQRAETANPRTRARQLLRRAHFFRSLPTHVRVALARQCRPRLFAPGEELFRQGEPGRYLVLVLSGEATVEIKGDSFDDSRILNLVHQGDILGEMSLTLGIPCSATVRAAAPLESLVIAADKFAKLSRMFPALGLAGRELATSRLGNNDVDALCGKRFDRYLVQGVLGTGATGVVYKAIDEIDGRTVALKLLKPMLVCDRIALRRFQRESLVLRKLRHPHVVGLDRDFPAAGSHCLAIEYCEQGSLADLIRREVVVDPPRVWTVVREVFAALDAAHRAGIIHRDLKPANVLLDSNGRCKLSDFGIAALQGSSQLTGSQDIVGTPRYMAPEQILGKPVGPAADLFALGCAAFEMLTGRPAISGRNVSDVIRYHVSGRRDLAPELPESIPNELRSFVIAALDEDPANRTTGVL